MVWVRDQVHLLLQLILHRNWVVLDDIEVGQDKPVLLLFIVHVNVRIFFVHVHIGKVFEVILGSVELLAFFFDDDVIIIFNVVAKWFLLGSNKCPVFLLDVQHHLCLV